MAITYTQNLRLGMQLDKTDYVNWDAITDNWRKIDEAVGGSGIRVGDATMMYNGINAGFVGIAEYDADIVDLLQEPYLSTVQNGSLTDNTGQPVSRADRATCYSYIDIPDERYRFKVDIAISGTAGKYFVDLYDENENYLYSATSSTDPLTGAAYYSFTNSGTFRTVHSDAKKIRVGVRNASNSNFSASSITEFKITFI